MRQGGISPDVHLGGEKVMSENLDGNKLNPTAECLPKKRTYQGLNELLKEVSTCQEASPHQPAAKLQRLEAPQFNFMKKLDAVAPADIARLITQNPLKTLTNVLR